MSLHYEVGTIALLSLISSPSHTCLKRLFSNSSRTIGRVTRDVLKSKKLKQAPWPTEKKTPPNHEIYDQSFDYGRFSLAPLLSPMLLLFTPWLLPCKSNHLKHFKSPSGLWYDQALACHRPFIIFVVFGSNLRHCLYHLLCQWNLWYHYLMWNIEHNQSIHL